MRSELYYTDRPGFIVNQNLYDLFSFPDSGVYTQVLLRTEKCTYSLSCLSAYQYLEFYNSSGNTALQVLCGNGTLELLDAEVNIELGTFLFIPAHTTRGIYAQTNLALLQSLSHEHGFETTH